MAATLKITKKNFSEWWDNIIFYADLIDSRYPLKGTYVWKPYGYAALKLMIKIMENLLDAKNHKECYFPIFIPSELFAKESEFLKGFGGETLRVTKVGHHELEQELIVRPTSETIIYPMLSLWIRSWRDLPIKLYQTVPIFRWETKMTKAMFRVREVIKFKEAHTAHASSEEAENQIKEAIEIYSLFFDALKLPYLILKTPAWETFAGALYNYDFITIMPDGKALELGSVINLGQKFAKAFNIKYKDKSGKEQYVWQTCYGISERSLGATLAIHGDDYGLIFLPIIAPIQIIIVPILKGLKEKDEAILNKAHELKKSLEPIYRVEIDLSEKSPGEKFYHWEAKGVPLRIELGEKELKNKEYAVAIRDIKFKEKISESELFSKLPKLFYEFEERLYKKAKEFFESKIKICKDLKSAEKHIKSGIVKLAWCGEEKCGKNLEEKLVGCALGYDETEQAKGKCVACGKNAKRILYFGRTY